VSGRSVATHGDQFGAIVASSTAIPPAPLCTGNNLAMPRADRLSLNADGLKMPTVDHMSNRGSLNVLLDRTISGLPAGLPNSRMLIGLFTNFVRLTDKALREYDAARAELVLYLQPSEGLLTGRYLRAIDHMENCVSATHRAVLNSKALRNNKIGRSGPRLTDRQESHLSRVRNAIEHSDKNCSVSRMGAATFRQRRALFNTPG
jgi:hypothetical protein